MRANNSNHDKVCKSCARPIYQCANCSKEFFPMRSDAITCSDACRVQRVYNRKHKLKSFAPGGRDHVEVAS